MSDADGPDLPLSTGPSALPSRTARGFAFAAIIVAGVCGGLIGYAIVHVSCRGRCATPQGVGSLTGAVLAAGGVAVVAVLVLRAMGEWRRIQAEQAGDEAGGEAGDEAGGEAGVGP
ncbi:MAG: hypothetical protein JO265_14490 [Acidimicrobiia bacterium]|nr:hypothetical protein [Acidimicrobiia bacterium]